MAAEGSQPVFLTADAAKRLLATDRNLSGVNLRRRMGVRPPGDVPDNAPVDVVRVTGAIGADGFYPAFIQLYDPLTNTFTDLAESVLIKDVNG